MSLPDDPDRLESTFIMFACGPEIADRRPFLHEHPELLTEKARNVIERIIRERIEGMHAYAELTQLRWMAALLRRAPEIGVDQAFEEFAPPPGGVFPAIAKLMRATTIPTTFKALIDHSRDLNTRDVRSALHFLRCKYADAPMRLGQLDAVEDAVDLLVPANSASGATAPVMRMREAIEPVTETPVAVSQSG